MNPFFSNLYIFPGLRVSFVSTESPAKKVTKPPVRRILRAGYVCEIIRDEHQDPAIHHWLVQDCDTDEVIALGQSLSLTEAESHAVAFLDDLRVRRVI